VVGVVGVLGVIDPAAGVLSGKMVRLRRAGRWICAEGNGQRMRGGGEEEENGKK
jgi:hypothetical protein